MQSSFVPTSPLPLSAQREDDKNNDQSSSPVSVMGLYPVVHDLTEIEYDCCDALQVLSGLLQGEEEDYQDGNDDDDDDEHQQEEEEEEDYASNLLLSERMLDEESKAFLQTPNLYEGAREDDLSSSFRDSLHALPDMVLPKPAALDNRRRASSCEIIKSSSSSSTATVPTPLLPLSGDGDKDATCSSTTTSSSCCCSSTLPLDTPVRHRRAMSDGAGQVCHSIKNQRSNMNPNHGTVVANKKNNNVVMVVGNTSNNNTNSHNNGSNSSPLSQKSFRDEYVPIRRIFECNDSTVWDSIHRKTGMHYCVKTVENNEKSAKEITKLRQAQSAYTVRLLEVIQEVDKAHIVMELMPGGNLLSRVIQKGPLPEATVQRMAHRLIRGVLHLHQTLSLCHNDLQPNNILLSNDKQLVKIADFGAATRCSQMPLFNSACHPPYRAPERQSSPAADMWSVGVILYFCLYGQHASLEQGCEHLFDQLHKASVKQEHDKPVLSRLAKQFLCNLIHVNPHVRLTAREALMHPWMRSMVEKKSMSRSAVESKPGSQVEELETATTPIGTTRQRRPGKRMTGPIGRFLTYVKGGVPK